MNSCQFRIWGIGILLAAGLAGCASFAHRTAALPAPAGPPSPVAFIDPLPGSRVISPFGKRGSRVHEGVDLKKNEEGGDSVVAARAGIVREARRSRSYGLTVVIVHPDGCRTRYAHLKKILVKEHQRVAAGQEIGVVGRTGRATGPHLHYEIRTCRGEYVDPAPYLRTDTRSVRTAKTKPKEAAQ